MKKLAMVFCLMFCVVAVSACGQAEEAPLCLGVNAVVTQVDADSGAITVKDPSEEDLFGEACRIDCGELPVIYCDYASQQVRMIAVSDLLPGDEVLLSISTEEMESYEKPESGVGSIRVEQIQLGTQRLT